MGAFSDRMQGTASRLLTSYGQAITLTRTTNNVYNPYTGAADPVTSATYTGVGQTRSYSLREIDGTNIQQNDVLLLLYTTSSPEIDDTTTLDNNSYRVMNVEKVNAQGNTILYRLQLRK